MIIYQENTTKKLSVNNIGMQLELNLNSTKFNSTIGLRFN
jgi:hypothetical protein